MNQDFVADSSVGISWSILSQRDTATETLQDEVVNGRRFVVPVLWFFEVANTLVMLTRRGRLPVQERQAASERLLELNPEVDPEGQDLALSVIATLAHDQTLTAYDAAYLELALRRGLPLASRDRRLNDAARRCGVETLL